jgi:hypothetical protein
MFHSPCRPLPPPRRRFGSGPDRSGPMVAPKRDSRSPTGSSGAPLPLHRGALALTLRGCDAQTLRGVALTFSVYPAAVAVRFASRLRLRPSCLSTWTLTYSSGWTPGSYYLPGLIITPGLTLTLEDLARNSGRASGPSCDGLNLRHVLPSMGFSAPPSSQHAESTSRRPFLHQLKLPRSRSPRRGFPVPLRSVFAVFRDLDGLRLRVPCGVFQPLTSLGLSARLPVPCPFTSVARTDPSGPRG